MIFHVHPFIYLFIITELRKSQGHVVDQSMVQSLKPQLPNKSFNKKNRYISIFWGIWAGYSTQLAIKDILF